MVDGYIALTKGKAKEAFYVNADLSCTWNGIFCEDFTKLFMLLADLGWSIAKEKLIPLPERNFSKEMPLPCRSRKAEFAHEWGKYLTANITNL